MLINLLAVHFISSDDNLYENKITAARIWDIAAVQRLQEVRTQKSKKKWANLHVKSESDWCLCSGNSGCYVASDILSSKENQIVRKWYFFFAVRRKVW